MICNAVDIPSISRIIEIYLYLGCQELIYCKKTGLDKALPNVVSKGQYPLERRTIARRESDYSCWVTPVGRLSQWSSIKHV